MRIPLPSVNRSRLSLRILQFASYQIGAAWAGTGISFDVAFVANPALWVWFPFAWLVRRKKKPAVFSVFDVFPHIGITLGVFRNTSVISAVGRLERFCLENSGIIGILSESFRPELRALGVPDEKMILTNIWVDTEFIRPMPRMTPFAKEHGLIDSFVVLYAGNLGLSQGLESILAASELLGGVGDIRFVVIGDGIGKEELMRQSATRGLTNVLFLPFQPRDRLPEVLATSDVSLVLLRKGVTADSLPSKIFSILASGRPVIASVDEGSEAWNLIMRAGAGLCVAPENPPELARAILNLKGEPRLCDRLGKNGRHWVECHHSKQAAAEQFEGLLTKATHS